MLLKNAATRYFFDDDDDQEDDDVKVEDWQERYFTAFDLILNHCQSHRHPWYISCIMCDDYDDIDGGGIGDDDLQ